MKTPILILLVVSLSATALAVPQPTPTDFHLIHGGPAEYFPKVHFSPDGRYVLVHDYRRITVLTVQPFSVWFRLGVEWARFVSFTPDSKELVFASTGSEDHVERWRLADKTRVGFTRISLSECVSAGLSPDGRVFVWFDKHGNLTMTYVESGETFRRIKGFGTGVFDAKGTPSNPGLGGIYFSPDGQFVWVIAQISSGAWDLWDKTVVRLQGELKRTQLKVPAFVAPDRILLSDVYRAKSGVAPAELVEFPSGKVVARPKLPAGPLYPAADPGFILVHTLGGISPGYLGSTAVNFRTGFKFENQHGNPRRLAEFLCSSTPTWRSGAVRDRQGPSVHSCLTQKLTDWAVPHPPSPPTPPPSQL